jgi:hypothetical protein
MTKRAQLARLERGPIAVQPIRGLALYRISAHDDGDPNSGVLIALASIGGRLVVRDDAAAYVQVNGRAVLLTMAEADQLAGRLRRLFTCVAPSLSRRSRAALFDRS